MGIKVSARQSGRGISNLRCVSAAWTVSVGCEGMVGLVSGSVGVGMQHVAGYAAVVESTAATAAAATGHLQCLSAAACSGTGGLASSAVVMLDHVDASSCNVSHSAKACFQVLAVALHCTGIDGVVCWG